MVIYSIKRCFIRYSTSALAGTPNAQETLDKIKIDLQEQNYIVFQSGNDNLNIISINLHRAFTSISSICGALRNLVPFVQFKKREKHPWRSVNFSKVTGWKLTLLYGCFSHFLNCRNGTKSRNAPHILVNFLEIFYIKSRLSQERLLTKVFRKKKKNDNAVQAVYAGILKSELKETNLRSVLNFSLCFWLRFSDCCRCRHFLF